MHDTLVLLFLSGSCMDHMVSSHCKKGGWRTAASLMLPLR